MSGFPLLRSAYLAARFAVHGALPSAETVAEFARRMRVVASPADVREWADATGHDLANEQVTS